MVPVELIIKILIVLLLAYFYYRIEKPKYYFFFFGVLFFLLALLLQLPFKLLEYQFMQIPYVFFQVSSLFIGIFGILITEATKYISLKKYMKTRKLKNGIFFGIGWVGFESISFLSIIIYSKLFAFFSLSFNSGLLVSSSLPLWSFLFFLIINSTITMFVIAAVIKRKNIYFAYAVLFSIIVYVTLYFSGGSLLAEIIFLAYSSYTLFNSKRFIK
jgi:hypothetical protein